MILYCPEANVEGSVKDLDPIAEVLSAITFIALVPVQVTNSMLALPPKFVEVQETVMVCPVLNVPLFGAVTDMEEPVRVEKVLDADHVLNAPLLHFTRPWYS